MDFSSFMHDLTTLFDPPFTAAKAGAVIQVLIALGGLFAIVRNIVVFFLDAVRGRQGKAWYDRPYFFRAFAWLFTLGWFYSPYILAAIQIPKGHWVNDALGLFSIAAAFWLWVQRISFLDGIPQQEFHLGPAWARRLGWEGHAGFTYIIQLISAVAIGVLFTYYGQDVVLRWLVAVPFLILTAGMSFWRTSIQGQGYTLGERFQQVIGGRGAVHHDPSK